MGGVTEADVGFPTDKEHFHLPFISGVAKNIWREILEAKNN
jgi:hypothetical protein